MKAGDIERLLVEPGDRENIPAFFLSQHHSALLFVPIYESSGSRGIRMKSQYKWLK